MKYEEAEKLIRDAKFGIIEGIKDTLKSKNTNGSEIYESHYVWVGIKYGGLVIVTDIDGTEWNAENLPVDDLLPVYRATLHIIPNL